MKKVKNKPRPFSWMNPKLEARETEKYGKGVFMKNNKKPIMGDMVNSKICLECKRCCIFDDKDSYLAPHLSIKESKLIRRYFLEKEEDFYKIKLEKYKKNKKLLRCSFLREANHRCLIYEKRPMECRIWPFVIGKGKNKGSVYLYVVNSDWCPAVIKNKLKSGDAAESVFKFIKVSGFLDEIKRGERYIWPPEDYYIKIKKLI